MLPRTAALQRPSVGAVLGARVVATGHGDDDTDAIAVARPSVAGRPPGRSADLGGAAGSDLLYDVRGEQPRRTC